MKKVILIYGVIAGLIVGVMIWINSSLVFEKKLISMDKSELMGYATMVIALSMIFFGIKSFRDNYSRGKISFWKGLQIGLLITLIASVFYFAGAEFYSLAHPSFKTQVLDESFKKLKEKASTPEQAQNVEKQMALMDKLFDNPLLFFVVCFIEIVPVGIVITLICAAILRKKEVLPTAANVAISVS